MDKDPTIYAALTYTWVLLLSLMGGLVSFIRKLNKAKKPQPLSLIFLKLMGELCISGFAGILTFYLCEYWNFSQLLTAVLVGISGHMGGTAIDKITQIFDKITDKS